MKAKSLVLGIIAGGTAAAVATLLTAPASGKETRQKLSANKDEVMKQLSDVKDSLLEMKQSISTLSKEGKTSLETFLHDVKLSVYEWKLNTDSNKAELQKDIKEIEQTIQDLESELAPPAKQ
ncbi:YtxH domain-containing protein [Mesobacillus zeae]|uniref:YtxH domain-containing protein n=1 Tax=Mesobacillus zeae TaxID=1917180 RepID=A0A398B457_9BACI|nr:YtxH domain-containing protein [Mesobacillus zeae]RID84622.1 YtxH domain-containing protein [Mesobacillus zeae]